MTASPEQAREFGAAFRSFLGWVHNEGADHPDPPVVALLREHLGPVGTGHSVVARELPPYEQVNLQTALDAWGARPGRTVSVHGLTTPPHYQSAGLQQLVTGEDVAHIRLSAPELVDLPSGPGRVLACVQTALLTVSDGLGRYALLVRGPERHQQPTLTVEVAGLATAQAQAVQAELADLRSRLNVYRGHVIDIEPGQFGMQLGFAQLPVTARADVVLPDAVLRRVERHTVDIAAHREQLLAAGQHLKRGLLLYGPPGTGKTHTTRYLVGRLTGYTVLLLSGRSLALIGPITALARELQPAAVVLEDVDLVAEDRGFGPGSSPVLFDLLDAMDGAAADADLLFLLTTNRADLLEPALAARPGRVDVAVEIGLPDATARRRLFELYGAGVPLQLTDGDVEGIVERTAGVTASFLKELLRRAVLEALQDGGTAAALTVVTAEHTSRALDDLLDSTQHVTRALLGVSTTDPTASDPTPPNHPGGRAAGGHGGLLPPPAPPPTGPVPSVAPPRLSS